MSWDSFEFRIKFDPLYALDVIRSSEYSSYQKSVAQSKLVSIYIINFHHIQYYGLEDFYKFNPAIGLCGDMLRECPGSATKSVLLACIALKYDTLFFEFKGSDFDAYYDFAQKFDNQKVLDWLCEEPACKEKGFEKKEFYFDYSLFVPYT